MCIVTVYMSTSRADGYTLRTSSPEIAQNSMAALIGLPTKMSISFDIDEGAAVIFGITCYCIWLYDREYEMERIIIARRPLQARSHIEWYWSATILDTW